MSEIKPPQEIAQVVIEGHGYAISIEEQRHLAQSYLALLEEKKWKSFGYKESQEEIAALRSQNAEAARIFQEWQSWYPEEIFPKTLPQRSEATQRAVDLINSAREWLSRFSAEATGKKE